MKTGSFITMWVIGAIANMLFWGFVVWAIYKLVMHFTS